MTKKLSPHFIDLIHDALVKSFWRKKTLKIFLRRSGVADNYLATLSSDDSKREWLDQLFPKLEASEKGRALLLSMSRTLAEQTHFPDLLGWEDSEFKVKQATESVSALHRYLTNSDRETEWEQEVIRKRTEGERLRQQAVASRNSLTNLKDKLDSLCQDLGTQRAGYEFQDWFFDLADFSEVESRRPYTVSGRQIDGSITVDGTTYLVELKFTATQADATAVDSHLKKVNDKADNTMGIIVSMSGFSSVAISEASFPRSPLLLLDHAHLYHVLGAWMSLVDLIRRVRRHSSQEGKAYWPLDPSGA